MIIKTLDLPGSLSFDAALQAMLEGKCLGIRPKGNTAFMTLYHPHWMNDQKDFFLRWAGTSDGNIRTSQLIDTWSLVVVDHREIKE